MKKVETIVLDKPDEYDLVITLVVQGWYGGLGGGIYRKTVTSDQLEIIRKNPLQDYINYGVQAVVYADIEIYPIYHIGDYTVKSNTSMDDRITAWNNKVEYLHDRARDFIERLMNDGLMPEPVNL